MITQSFELIFYDIKEAMRVARPFEKKDAKNLINEYKNILKELDDVQKAELAYSEEVKSAVKNILMKDAMQILKNIPIEELNRDKKGIRVKTLRDNGYGTIADIAYVSTNSLEAVKGISMEAALLIRKEADEIVLNAQKGVKLKLNADTKTPERSGLVRALFKYRTIKPVAHECKKLFNAYNAKITDAVLSLEKANGTLKWLFASGDKKKKAEEGYAYLSSLQFGSTYGQTLNDIVLKLACASNCKDEEAWKSFESGPVEFFSCLEEITPGVLGNDDALYGLPEDLAREIQNEKIYSEGMLCELRKYQQWGVKYILHQRRVLLGDEMGLGKTVQAIAAMVSLHNNGGTHFMVVCPASVLSNWCREIKKMSELKVTKIHGPGKHEEFRSWIRTGGVGVTTFETTAVMDMEDSFKYKMLVVDEAHYIKNPKAHRSENVKTISFHADRVLLMTGTALENNVDEMVSLIDILRPDIANKAGSMKALSAAEQFREAVAPVYYRRKREDVLTELPELIDSREWCTLSDEEEEAYETSVMSKNYALVRRVSWNVPDISRSSKAARLMEIVEDAKEDGRKIIVFSFFLETIRKISELLGNQCLTPITGSITPQHRQEIIDEFDKAPAGTVLVSQIQSGGTGLNIQSASVVVLCEPQFKPSIENQAISRAYRMGQTRNVLVYRLLCEDTIEEKIMAVLEKKQEIFDSFADKSAVADESRELDEKSFSGLVEEERKRICLKKGEQGAGAVSKENEYSD